MDAVTIHNFDLAGIMAASAEQRKGYIAELLQDNADIIRKISENGEGKAVDPELISTMKRNLARLQAVYKAERKRAAA